MKKIIFLFIIFNLIACGYSNTMVPIGLSGENNAQGSPGAALDFLAVKSQFFEPQCLRCHSNAGGNRGGVNLETYVNVSNFLSRVQSAVNSGVMPPSGSLSTSMKSILNNWISAGAPEFATDPPAGGGGTPNPPSNDPINPGDDDCDDDDDDDDLIINGTEGLVKIQSKLYYDVNGQFLIQLQKRDDNDCN